MRTTDPQGKTFFRSGDRVFSLNGQWYFQTREHDHGPFPSRTLAEQDLARYVSEMEHFASVLNGSDQFLGKPRPAPTKKSDLRLLDPSDY